MGKWTRLWRYCVPHGARAAMLIILGFALLVAAFTLDVCPAWLKYAAYLLSAYATLALCANVGRWFRYCKAWIEGCAPARHYIHDSDFRNRVSLCWGVCANALYAALQGVLALIQRSGWMVALCGYYTVLTLMRLLVYRSDPHALDTRAAWRRYGAVGLLLILLAGSIQAILLQYLLKGKAFEYPGFSIYAMAAYSFTSLTMVIVRMIRYRKSVLPLQRAALNIRFAAALMSLLALQTALISTFGEPDTFQFAMNALTGCAVFLALLAMALVMLSKAMRQLIGRRT